MKYNTRFWLLLAVACCSSSNAADLPLQQVNLPPGFKITVFADQVDDARQLARGDQGTVFVGSRRAGKVYALTDADGDFVADQLYTIASGLNMPSGIAYRDGSLYVAAVDRVLRYDDIENHLATPPKPVLVSAAFPTDKHHGWKFIDFGPDGMLYVPVGAPCNICDADGYAEIKRMQPDGSGLQTYASGVRNSVGFDWDPVTGELWFTDNGRDMLGDNTPAFELNHAPQQGMHFGFPYCHAGEVTDPEFGAGQSCADYVAPAQKLGPHVAPLGMMFYTGTQFPEQYRNQIFIPEHGSWNRSEKIGYRIMLVTLDKDRKAINYAPFASGWLQGQQNWGRPVDLMQLPDGSMLLSDDQAGVIYRISYSGDQLAFQNTTQEAE
jgi:glucose/arabinose dehydrogenase